MGLFIMYKIDSDGKILLQPGVYFLIGPNGTREITDYYSLTPRERWLLRLPQLQRDEE